MPMDVEDEIRQLDKRFFRIEVLFGVTIALAATFGVGGIWLSHKITESKKSISEIEKTVAEMQNIINDMQRSIKQMESQTKAAQESLDRKQNEALTKMETTADLLISRLKNDVKELQKNLEQNAKEYLNQYSEDILRRIKNLEDAREQERELINRERASKRDIPIAH